MRLRRAPLVFATAFIPGANRALLRSATAVLDREVARVIADRRATNDQPADLLTHLLSCRDTNGNPLDERLIRDQIATTIFGATRATGPSPIASIPTGSRPGKSLATRLCSCRS